MKSKRAIGFAILIYIASFVVGILTSFFINADFSMSNVPVGVWIIGILASIILTACFTKLYFKKVDPSFSEGIKFGIVVILISTILDFLIVIPSVLYTNTVGDIVSYYTNPLFWVIVASVILTAGIVGKKQEYLETHARPSILASQPVMARPELEETSGAIKTRRVSVRKTTKKKTSASKKKSPKRKTTSSKKKATRKTSKTTPAKKKTAKNSAKKTTKRKTVKKSVKKKPSKLQNKAQKSTNSKSTAKSSKKKTKKTSKRKNSRK